MGASGRRPDHADEICGLVEAACSSYLARGHRKCWVAYEGLAISDAHPAHSRMVVIKDSGELGGQRVVETRLDPVTGVRGTLQGRA